LFQVSAKGVFRLGGAKGELGEPVPLLKLPAKEGETWTVERPGSFAKGPGGSNKATYTVGKEEEVEVPAGKFKAIRVEMALELRGGTLKSSTWYAAGVGIIKVVTPSGDKERTQVLKSFTPGK
jgi:hypothetical protein